MKPRIVCLCGSTRFKDKFAEANLTETMLGNVVLSIGCDMRTDQEVFGILDNDQKRWPENIKKIKKRLDLLRFYKIKMSDEVLVLNVGGYIGESTRREIFLALFLGKEVRSLEPIAWETLVYG